MKRLFTNNTIYHIYNRGARKSEIFRNDMDRHRFIELLGWHQKYKYPYSSFLTRMNEATSPNKKETEKIIGTYHKHSPIPVEIYTYALMPNHFHLLIKQLSSGGITLFMRELAIGYALYFNRKNNESGSVFQGRFKFVEIKTGEQFLNVARYIHRNPIESNLVENLEQLQKYRWTSYSEYFTPNLQNTVTKTNELLNYFTDIQDLASFTGSSNQVDIDKQLTFDGG